MSPIKFDLPPTPAASTSSSTSTSASSSSAHGRKLRSSKAGMEYSDSTISAPSPVPGSMAFDDHSDTGRNGNGNGNGKGHRAGDDETVPSNQLLLDVRAYHPHLTSPRTHRAELDLAHTPPAKTFTPSPPMSRSQSDVDLQRLGRYEGENELAVLMRTIDFAARVETLVPETEGRGSVTIVSQLQFVVIPKLTSCSINHPIAVANFLSTTGITDVRVLQAAVAVQQADGLVEEIAQLFGTDVARIVEECTDDNTLTGQQRKIEQLQNAPYKSREAQQVKLADKLHNLESIRRSPPVGWGIKRIQAYFIWAKQVTDVCAPSHPALARRLQYLYETAYTRVNGVYYPCHPEMCGPLTEEEKDRVDARLRALKPGATMKPEPIFF